MIGSLDPTEKKATIIGAGISGLLIAYALKKSGFQVQVLEASSRVGGLIETVQTPFGLAEKAAHSLLVTPEALTLFQELGISLAPVNSKSKARYIYRNRKMRRMPLSFREILQTLIAFLSAPKKPFNPQTASLEEWGNTYLGSPATKFLLAPFVTGVFATSPKELIARLAFPKLVPASPALSLYRHFKSGKKTAHLQQTRPQMMAPKNGLSDLVLALRNALKDEIKLGSPISELPKDPNLILTVPSAALSKLIRKDDAVSAEKLLQIRYAPLISVTCFYKKSAFAKEPRGVGVLVPRNEGLRLLGCLFNSSAFPNRTIDDSYVSLTVMYGGSEDPAALSLTDGELSTLLHQEIRTLLGAKSDSAHLEITRWDRAIPIYSAELEAAQEALKLGFCAHPGRLIFSNFSKEVSIRGLINATLQL
jgi:oxygen-dependent protoporphyrinogen oxidase